MSRLVLCPFSGKCNFSLSSYLCLCFCVQGMRGLGHSVRLFLSLGLDHVRAELPLHVTTMCENPVSCFTAWTPVLHTFPTYNIPHGKGFSVFQSVRYFWGAQSMLCKKHYLPKHPMKAFSAAIVLDSTVRTMCSSTGAVQLFSVHEWRDRLICDVFGEHSQTSGIRCRIGEMKRIYQSSSLSVIWILHLCSVQSSSSQ